MKSEEKIEVMLEAILKSLEQISRKLEREPGGEVLDGIKETPTRSCHQVGKDPGTQPARAEHSE